ncbi:MAG: 8-amino-7-oxononanoate synthase [Gammaproteobacteria bacterium]|nr:MAG: 8-amino-7-oxononanoate synthase [Gammaproteobacteria bacterium]RLA22419.1 MAG: 8-amino-7-oxononanoate synthase [Gammaproteobacteria bacterium]
MSLKEALEQRRKEGLYRTRKVIQTAQSTEVEVGGRKVINFCSNDYLGLANHPDVIAAFQQGAARYGVGSGSAHLVCGHSEAHHTLEEALAKFTGRDRALLFSTGYMANMGAISALIGRSGEVFEDRLNHASLLDGGWLSTAKFSRYRHADMASLESLLKKSTADEKLLVSDGVFSMDGDIAPLPEMVALCEQYGVQLLIDDAHGFGVLGEQGGGCASYYSLSQKEIPVLVGTLGKAFGTFGAFVAGSEELIEYLIQKSRSYIYTTALPPAVAEATLTSLKILQEEDWRRERLKKLIGRFRIGAERLGIKLMTSETPIQPILIGESDKATVVSERLLKRGIWISAIRPPTVPKGSARLRVTLSAEHSDDQLDRLLDALAGAMYG